MAADEIEVPLAVREDLPHWVEETPLGDRRGAIAQYRYGNLHIRRYADRYTVHADEADPRRDPIGHLVRDAPGVLAAAAAVPAAAYAAWRIARALRGGP
ncbi:MAG: hypothetical protein OXU86_05545 [Thaumarchaeota archaeon]|nr:hypothetical protein [Nitrososphaerota archaeon]RNJ71945.1 MAG: hypothetical protein EB833_05945 [Thaumarchaeota archaeon S13]RNJ76924.1 MAG: hypothetical protein EB824_00050 [Thaumarchaeota archaeon S15]